MGDHLYNLNDFSDTEKLRILDIICQVAVEGQKKGSGNKIQRTVCKIMEDMINQVFVRVATERDESNEER